MSLATELYVAVICGISTVSIFKSQTSFKCYCGELARIENSSYRSLRWDRKLLRQSPYHIDHQDEEMRWHEPLKWLSLTFLFL